MQTDSVLIIDDNAVVREALADTLGGLGFCTTTACDGVDGLEKFTRGSYDVVLTDLEMPRISGVEVTRRVRETRPDVGVVVISGSLESGAAPPAWAGNRVAFVEKPPRLEDVTAAIARVAAPGRVARAA